MPIRISKYDSSKSGGRGIELAWLCGDDFDLPLQLAALSSWLLSEGKALEPGHYSAHKGQVLHRAFISPQKTKPHWFSLSCGLPR